MNSKTRLGENWGQSGMRSEWKKYALEDVCEKIYSGGTPSTKHPEYWNGNIKWLSSGETSQRFVYDTERKITQLGVDNSSTKKATKGCTVIATAGQGYTRGQASFLMTDTYMNQSVIACKANEKIIDPLFLYYNLDNRYEEFRLLSDGTSTRGGLSGWIVKRIEIQIPCIAEQCTIARILKSLDEKIEVNNKINKNLLEQALILYATRFSSLDKNSCIGNYCAVKSGFAFKSSWWTNSGVKVIKIGSINQDNLNLLECSYVNEDKADKAKDFVVKAGDLLIAMTGATIGKFAMVPYSSEVLLVNQRVGKFFLGNNPVEKLPFIYCTLKQPEVYSEVVNRGQGSAQPNISASDIMSIPCAIPSQEEINIFNNTARPLFDLIISNQRENRQLSELRDTLLPKLMSGDLDVSNIDI